MCNHLTSSGAIQQLLSLTPVDRRNTFLRTAHSMLVNNRLQSRTYLCCWDQMDGISPDKI